LVVIAIFGAALVVMPVAFNMFNKAPQGASMLVQFKPFMTTNRLDGFQSELKEINLGIRQTDSNVVSALTAGKGGRATFDSSYPTFASVDRQWPTIDRTMTNLMDEVQRNQGNYEAMAALPSFRLFPWFFVGPGAVLFLVALLLLARPRWWSKGRWGLVVLGVALIAAPVVFQMFSRAPKGGQMMTAFKHIETTSNVENIQSYFGTMAEGQGAIRLNIVPALERAGYSAGQIRTDFPAVATLDAQWVHILNDMTPMIGAMSDSVPAYQAISSLPPFPLFPWFFVAPGVLIIGLTIAGGRDRRDRTAQVEHSTTNSLPALSGGSS
jgi:hypothetical protein